MTEDRIARAINTTMMLLLGMVLIGFVLWTFGTHLVAVRGLYERLPSADQREVRGLVESAGMLLLLAGGASSWIGHRRKRRAERRAFVSEQ